MFFALFVHCLCAFCISFAFVLHFLCVVFASGAPEARRASGKAGNAKTLEVLPVLCIFFAFFLHFLCVVFASGAPEARFFFFFAFSLFFFFFAFSLFFFFCIFFVFF